MENPKTFIINETQLALLLQIKNDMIKEVVNEVIQQITMQAAAEKPPASRCKGYNLVKRESKKYGFKYYVRYWHDGKMLPSKWCTQTNNLEDAQTFAIKNRDKLIREYMERQKRVSCFKILSDFFKKNSMYYNNELRHNRGFSDNHRRMYYKMINNYFIPYLKEQKINTLEKIDAVLISDFQDHLLAKDLKPQTINSYLCGIKKIFSYLCSKGKIANNPFNNVTVLTVLEKDREMRGCYEIDKFKNIFNGAWKDEMSYMINLLMYSTGMRNCEIEKLEVEDIIDIDGHAFIEIKEKSKTENGKRLIPLHGYVKEQIAKYIEKHKRERYIFTRNGKKIQSRIYKKAAVTLGMMLGMSEDELTKEHISFYSGRHFWKTMMNAEGLGDIEEVFMGHKVTNDVSKLYNHRDKQGRENFLKKAEAATAIFGKTLFPWYTA
jgi:integrase